MWWWSRGAGRRWRVANREVVACRRLVHSESDAPVGEFLDKHLASSGPSVKGVTSTRREVLSLYRDVVRASRIFTWPNQDGVLWKDVLRLSARREFEAARLERDPETIARLLVVGRDAVRATLEKFSAKREELIIRVDPGERRP